MGRYFKSNNGAALITVLMVMVIMSILGTVALKIASHENRMVTYEDNKLKAYYIARSGAHAMAEYMIKDINNDANELIGKESDWNEQVGGGRFKVKVVKDPISKTVHIVSTGEYRGVRQDVKINVTYTSKGVGGIFDHAIATKQDIYLSGGNGNKTEVFGTVGTKEGVVSVDKAVLHGGYTIDPNLTFPDIVLPPDRTPPMDYDIILGDIEIDDNVPAINTSGSSPVYISTGSITRQNNEIRVTGDGVAHMFVNGDINMNTNSRFNVSSTAKLYVYVVGNRTITFRGSGSQNHILLYAPDSTIIWNNAQHNLFEGIIIGKEVGLTNQLTFVYDGTLVNDVDLDTTGVGVTFTGYNWID